MLFNFVVYEDTENNYQRALENSNGYYTGKIEINSVDALRKQLELIANSVEFFVNRAGNAIGSEFRVALLLVLNDIQTRFVADYDLKSLLESFSKEFISNNCESIYSREDLEKMIVSMASAVQTKTTNALVTLIDHEYVILEHSQDVESLKEIESNHADQKLNTEVVTGIKYIEQSYPTKESLLNVPLSTLETELKINRIDF